MVKFNQLDPRIRCWPTTGLFIAGSLDQLLFDHMQIKASIGLEASKSIVARIMLIEVAERLLVIVK